MQPSATFSFISRTKSYPKPQASLLHLKPLQAGIRGGVSDQRPELLRQPSRFPPAAPRNTPHPPTPSAADANVTLPPQCRVGAATIPPRRRSTTSQPHAPRRVSINRGGFGMMRRLVARAAAAAIVAVRPSGGGVSHGRGPFLTTIRTVGLTRCWSRRFAGSDATTTATANAPLKGS